MPTVTNELLQQFESRLLTVERCASQDRPFSEFFELLLRAIRTVGDIHGCTVWLYSHGIPERVLSTSDVSTAPELPAARNNEDRFVSAHDFSVDSKVSWNGYAFEDVSGAFTICLEVRCQDVSDESLLREATLALSECTASWFRRSLIARIDDKLLTQSSANEFCHAVYPRLNDSNFAFTMATEIRSLLKVDRVSLVLMNAGKSEIAGISGTDRLDPTLETPAAIRNLSDALFEHNPPELKRWIPLEEFGTLLPGLSAESIEIFSNGRTNCIRGMQLRPTSAALQHSDLEWRVIAEVIGANVVPSEVHWKSCEAQICRVISSARRPVRPGLQKLKQIRKTSIACVGMLVLICLGLIPVNFEIDATGQMVPLSERKIFAPGSGNIQELSVSHESQVEAGQQLVRIHSPELALKIQEVLGQLETERVRLSSLQRSRLSANVAAMAREGVEQALGGEQAVRQRITGLEDRLRLLRTQQDRLLITAEFPGRVYRRNLELDLNARPVQQGDFLFDLIDDKTTWQLELEIPEDMLQYVRPGVFSTGDKSANVRFSFVSQPEVLLGATVTRFEDSVVHKNGQSNGVAFAAILPDSVPQTKQYRLPGVTVSARIDCGKRSAFFVMFREFIEFVREKSFRWF